MICKPNFKLQMKQLMLIRHAKSSWDLQFNDHERPLAPRGNQDAQLVSVAIEKYLPDNFMIWCSTAKRARETALIFAKNIFLDAGNIVFKEELYTFDNIELARIIKSCDDDIDNLIVFGHNEAITNFVNKFGNTFIDNVPTCGFVSIIFDSKTWKNIGRGVTKNVVFPRDLR